MKKDLQRKIDYAKKIQRAQSCKKTGLLGIDPANELGWACSDGTFGIWNLTLRKNESQGIKWTKFENLLRIACKEKKIKIIAFEEASGTHINAIKHHSKLTCVIEKFCCENNIEYIGYNVKTIKMFLTNNGNAKKEMMVEFAKKHFNYDGNNHNEADAIAILNLLKSEL